MTQTHQEMKYPCHTRILRVKYSIISNSEYCIKRPVASLATRPLHSRQLHIKFPLHLCFHPLSTNGRRKKENRIKATLATTRDPSEFNFMNHFDFFYSKSKFSNYQIFSRLEHHVNQRAPDRSVT